MSLNLPEDYVGLTDTSPASLTEHAEQVQRNFEAIARSAQAQVASLLLPSAQRVGLLTGAVAGGATTLLAGTGGWAVARTPAGVANGDYTITFTSAFASANVIPALTAINFCVVTIQAVTTATIRVMTFNAAAVNVDAAFLFHVIGAR